MALNLLPRHHDEFQSKSYWDRFFLERGNDAFEWYGSFTDASNNCIRHIRALDCVLVIGCGNSAFSQEFYDKGYKKLTNIDFSEQVISDMRLQNIHRNEMKWEVMDMTATSFANESFQVVFDKGALDALMSENTDIIKIKASSMFDEISRLLAPGGKYICITLAENFILNHVIAYFASHGWYIHTEVLTSATLSPYKPLFIVFNKPDPTGQSKNKSLNLSSNSSSSSSNSDNSLSVMFDPFGSPLKKMIWINQDKYIEMAQYLFTLC